MERAGEIPGYGARRLAALAALLVAGVFAGAQLGKIAPLVDWYRSEAMLSLVEIGLLTAALGFFVAIAALPAAFVIDRIGNFEAFVLSSVVLAVGAGGLAWFDEPSLVLAARLVEGLGYLAIVVCTPALLAIHSPAPLRAPLLAIWGGFVPIGFAIADFSAGALVAPWGPKVFLAAMALGFSVFALVAALLCAGLRPVDGIAAASEGTSRFAASLSAPVFVLAAAFAAYVVASLAFFAFLPPFVSAAGDGLLLSAGAIALLVPAGNVLTGVAMGGRGLRFAALLGVIGFSAGAASAVPFYASGDPLVATLAAVVFALAGGVVASALFAAVPFIVPAGGSAAIVIGVIAQSGGLATLAGPPAAGWVIETWSWPGMGWFLAAVSLAGAIVTLPLLRPLAKA